jgi:hypothetical protein
VGRIIQSDQDCVERTRCGQTRFELIRPLGKADGKVICRCSFRDQVDAAQLRGIGEGSPAFERLNRWLSSRPPAELFQKTLPAIRAMLIALPEQDQRNRKQSLVDYCTRVAAASGGILGFGQKVGDADKKLLEQIASELERDHRGVAEQVLGAKGT